MINPKFLILFLSILFCIDNLNAQKEDFKILRDSLHQLNMYELESYINQQGEEEREERILFYGDIIYNRVKDRIPVSAKTITLISTYYYYNVSERKRISFLDDLVNLKTRHDPFLTKEILYNYLSFYFTLPYGFFKEKAKKDKINLNLVIDKLQSIRENYYPDFVQLHKTHFMVGILALNGEDKKIPPFLFSEVLEMRHSKFPVNDLKKLDPFAGEKITQNIFNLQKRAFLSLVHVYYEEGNIEMLEHLKLPHFRSYYIDEVILKEFNHYLKISGIEEIKF